MTTNASKSVVSVYLQGTERCPAFGCLEITSTTERGGKTLYNVRKPTLLSGAGARYLLATEVPIRPGYGRAYDPRLGEPLYGLYFHSGSLGSPFAYGGSWGPYPGSWYLFAVGRGFRAIGNGMGGIGHGLFERVEDNASSSNSGASSLTLTTAEQIIRPSSVSGNNLNDTLYLDTVEGDVATFSLGRYSVSMECSLAIEDTTVTITLEEGQFVGDTLDTATVDRTVIETWTIENASPSSRTLPVYCRPIQYTPTFTQFVDGATSPSIHYYKAVRSGSGSATLSNAVVIHETESP